jgi:hypothetical protein
MSYGLIYKVAIPSLRKNNYSLEVEKKDYTGSSTILTGGAEPFTVSLDDDDFVYQPLRLSTGKLAVVGGSTLSSLFATAYQEYRVTLYKDTTPLWCGFVKPELYTQDYTAIVHEISIDCLSAIQTLEYVKYTQISTEGLKFVSLKSIISRALVAANAKYQKVYIPHTFAPSQAAYGTNALMQDDCVVSEQNFFDEENKPMSYKDILEEICRFAHVTLYDDGGSLYFADHDYTDAYDEWTFTNGTLTLTTVNALAISAHSVQDIGFGGTDHSLDIIAGYNKASVKTSNYNSTDKVFPEEEWDSLAPLSIELTQVPIVEAVKSGMTTKYTEVKARGKCIWLTPSKWETHVYKSTGLTQDGRAMHSLEVGDRGGYYYNGGNVIDEAVAEVTDLKTLQWDATDKLHSLGSSFDTQTAYETNQGLYTLSDAFQGGNRIYGAFLGKYCNWQLNDDGTDSISSYSYEHIMLIRKISMHGDTVAHGTSIPVHDTVTFNPSLYKGLFNYKGHMPVAAYADGAIAINLQVCPTGQGTPVSITGIAKNGFYYANEKNIYKAGAKVTLTFILKIGDTYYNGTTWASTPSTFTVQTEELKEAGTFAALKNTKVLSMPYNDLSGYVIETQGTLKGELYVELVDVDMNCAIKDFGMKFQLKDNYVPTDNASDRIYTNVVNEAYINELDEIEEKISSYNHDGLCYSKVLLGNDFITDNLYEGLNQVLTRPEDLLIRRIINQYSEPKIKLTQVLLYDSSLKPIDKLTDNFQGSKKFIITGREIKYRSETMSIQMIEKE